MVTLYTLSPSLLASSTSDGDGIGLGWILLLSGFIFYAYVFFRYRNADKRHRHESKTQSNVFNVQTADQKVRTRRGLRSSRMDGANNRSVRGSQHAFGKAGAGEQAISAITGSLFKR